MIRRRLQLRAETVRQLAPPVLARVRGGGDARDEDPSFVYGCTAPWSNATTCDTSNPYVCPMGPA